MQSDSPKIAVLLAAYNGSQWIAEQLESILGQLNVQTEIFISIDPSSDETEKICSEYASRNANIIVLPDCGSFGGAARNFFRLIRDVNFSAFDFIAFSDQDDIWYPTKLHWAASEMHAQNFDAYSSNVIAFWPDGRRKLIDKAQPQVARDHLFEAAGPGCTYVITRHLAEAFRASLILNWDTAQNVSLHDWYCYAFARSKGFNWFIDKRPSMDYRQHAGNQIGANSGAASFLKRLKKIMDGWWPRQVMLIDRLTGNDVLLNPDRTGSMRLTFLKLTVLARQCRRRSRDKAFFIVACLLATLVRM